jgi:hypothetical protein
MPAAPAAERPQATLPSEVRPSMRARTTELVAMVGLSLELHSKATRAAPKVTLACRHLLRSALVLWHRPSPLGRR